MSFTETTRGVLLLLAVSGNVRLLRLLFLVKQDLKDKNIFYKKFSQGNMLFKCIKSYF